MDLTPTLPQAVYTVWKATIIAVVLVVPLAVFLLHRTLKAAWSIRRYLAEMEAAGRGIAANTAPIVALNDTRAVALDMRQTAGALFEHTSTIAQVLSQRAQPGSTP
ncbi:MAG: hypothetical protein M3R16_11950 [Pseudomonadota bacterium]|nr:hypothetical protein [Pseudomonadota bacterium]